MSANDGENERRDGTQFIHALAPSRLGKSHSSLLSFHHAVYDDPSRKNEEVGVVVRSKTKHYSLIVVTEETHSRQRILLGLKNRGFGKGFWNSFGGKVEPGEDIVDCAMRELQEETGIDIPHKIMSDSSVGLLRFTFDDDDDDLEMMVHLFRVHISLLPLNMDSELSNNVVPVDPSCIRGCEEITPKWFDNWYDIPLGNMFADDSIWLTKLLSSKTKFQFNGHFHFHPGGQEVNSIMHYFLDIQDRNSLNKEPIDANATLNSKDVVSDKEQERSEAAATDTEPKYSLEKQLFHAVMHTKNSLAIKEFKECYAFVNGVRFQFRKDDEADFDAIIDVAGGHGALGALFLVMTGARVAVVVDPAKVGNNGVQNAWGGFFSNKSLEYRYECLRTGLPGVIQTLTSQGRQLPNGEMMDPLEPRRILVVACHACQHLSDEVLAISSEFGVHVAVMPCCQKDPSPGSAWKAAGKNIGVPVAPMMDLLLAGKMMSWGTGASAGVTYDVRMKVIDKKITPQNRMIICRAKDPSKKDTSNIDKAHKRLENTYKKAHAFANMEEEPRETHLEKYTSSFCPKSLFVGLAAGIVISLVVRPRQT